MATIRRVAISMVVAVSILGLLAQPVAANHGGAFADCGSAGTFTVRVTQNPARQAPPGGAVLLFEEGGTLSPRRAVVNGQVVFDVAPVGTANNNVDEVTCSYKDASGNEYVVTGVFTDRH